MLRGYIKYTMGGTDDEALSFGDAMAQITKDHSDQVNAYILRDQVPQGIE